MTDKELSYLRDLHAGFAMIGLIMKGEATHNVPTKAYLYADEMQIARTAESPAGIVSVKSKRKSNEQN